MADTQHLQVSQVLDANHTPYKRGHRHKRSFAISGEFEFLKQMEPSTMPPMSCASPDQAAAPPPPPQLQPQMASPTLHATPASFQQPETEYASYSRILQPTNQSLQSPKFFVSEEPKFSSPFKGVPDAIINLDDALKTKPRSFKSHRRAESAPADLEVFMNTREPSGQAQMIEEEEDDDVQSDLDSGNGHLMSPLRPTSPSPRPLGPATASPTRIRDPQGVGVSIMAQGNGNGNGNSNINGNNNNNGNRNFNNSLKINRQKQRYYHYTKQLPINAASSIQSQSLKGQASSGSLSSAYMQTPASVAHTPSKQMSTPLTPVSNNNMRYKNEVDRTTSPTLRHQKLHNQHTPRDKNNIPSGFNYQSKLYDMPHTITVTKSPSSDNRTLAQSFRYSQEEQEREAQLPLPLSSSSPSLTTSSSPNAHDNEQDNSIPESLLFGEPGDVEDPTNSMNHDFEPGLQNAPAVCVGEHLPARTNNTCNQKYQEPRTVSDSFCITERERKKKSRLSSLMSLFSKSPYH
ncbi:LRE1 (YCL051W) and HLR1 (YDR528W) [Zygosaccharomyces parabailii]|nr:LRE1 (YCL051W) and HLR1 (YDR528W) [Zygosaccharomyces parabailii]CDH09837.1 uncharacterized protein ZBAI_01621 [Zygosaccharomyces bailii ISA1307]